MVRTKYSAIGIDIGAHSVKCVQLAMNQGKITVRDKRCIPLENPHEYLQETPEQRQARTLSALKRSLRLGSFSGHECLTAIRLYETKTRHVRISIKDESQIEESLRREVYGSSELVPDDSQPKLQWLPVADMVERSEHRREYLCCVAEQGIIADHLELLQAAKLDPLAIDLDCCAQVRPFAGANHDQSLGCLYVDLGCDTTRLTITREGQPVLMQSIPIGGSHFEKTLSERLNLDRQAILDVSQAHRNDQENQHRNLELSIARMLSEHLDAIADRILACIRYAGTLFGARSVGAFRVVGGAASIPGVVDSIRQNLKLKIHDSDPFRALGIETQGGVSETSPSTFATAVGLALRGLRP